ncbi:MAG: DUF86 domain-containing protein [Planctomycetes bacterium]|nr:DUF86 domain-containing protein [Planctomycetota bacterium]
MKNPAGSYLSDIVKACEAVLEFIKGQNFRHYQASLLLRSAVERQLTIIGEATVQLKAKDAAVAGLLGDVRSVVAFRNILIHGYFKVDDKVVWQVLADDVPRYLDSARAALKQVGGA